MWKSLSKINDAKYNFIKKTLPFLQLSNEGRRNQCILKIMTTQIFHSNFHITEDESFGLGSFQLSLLKTSKVTWTAVYVWVARLFATWNPCFFPFKMHSISPNIFWEILFTHRALSLNLRKAIVWESLENRQVSFARIIITIKGFRQDYTYFLLFASWIKTELQLSFHCLHQPWKN